MKQLNYVVIIAIFFNMPCYAVMAYGFLERTVIFPDRDERSPWGFVSDEQPYTNGTGGITFTYPAGIFTSPPCVQISIMQNANHPSSETYVAEVSANSTSSTTVMVYEISSGLVSEAGTGLVTVCILALDNPAV